MEEFRTSRSKDIGESVVLRESKDDGLGNAEKMENVVVVFRDGKIFIENNHGNMNGQGDHGYV